MQCKNHQGTFLAWIDCRKVCAADESFIERIKKEGHVLLDDGRRYGAGGEGFIRMNVACNRQLLEQALKNIKQIYENIWNKEGR